MFTELDFKKFIVNDNSCKIIFIYNLDKRKDIANVCVLITHVSNTSCLSILAGQHLYTE